MSELLLLFNCFTLFSQDDWLFFQGSQTKSVVWYKYGLRLTNKFMLVISTFYLFFYLSALKIPNIFVISFVHFCLFTHGNLPFFRPLSWQCCICFLIVLASDRNVVKLTGLFLLYFPKVPFTENYMLSM